jgi:2-oxoglutarate dehydrogenase E1 component
MKAVSSSDLLRLKSLVGIFRSKGHQIAALDPLSREWGEHKIATHWLADPEATGLKKMMRPDDSHVPNLKAGGFSNVVKLDSIIPNDCLMDIVGPHWKKDQTQVGKILETMWKTYCSTSSAEYTHVQTSEQFHWLSSQLENHSHSTATEKRTRYEHLVRADHFEKYLRQKYKASKTYGISGCESLLPGLHALCATASSLGVEHIELGMSHRGRLSVLCNLLKKPMGTLFDEFNDDGTTGSVSDVKYHLGARGTLHYSSQKVQKELQLSLVPNPSHLELVVPVVLGKTRAVQHFMRDSERKKAMAVCIHGDAAFSGQGITSESLELSQLPDYTTGGSVHVVVNNQIGFTTDPHISRSSLHPTGNVTAVGAPVFHVNGDDVDKVVRMFQIAVEYRQKFHRDCVVDIVCYRREGHNELDDPTITQPRTYEIIRQQPTTVQIYTQKLVDEGVLASRNKSSGSISDSQNTDNGKSKDKNNTLEERLRQKIGTEFEHEFQRSRSRISSAVTMSKNLAAQRMDDADDVVVPSVGAKLVRTLSNVGTEWLASNWRGERAGDSILSGHRPYNMTGVSMQTLHRIGRALGPNNIKLKNRMNNKDESSFVVHPEVKRLMKAREQNVLNNGRVDMSTAEALAMGALALPLIGGEEGRGGGGGYTDHPTVHVRLSGQDSERGTFNQRHAVVVCQKTERRHVPLNSIIDRCWPEKERISTKGSKGLKEQLHQRRVQETVNVTNSNLSENAVLAFEYGHSLENERCLTIWEAQFGDFANGAQSVIDNMISSGEIKWKSSSGLVMMLPHGLEGQGPEHSSARIERFLQLIDDDPDQAPGFTVETESKLRDAFRRTATRSDGYGVLHRNEMYDLLAHVNDIVREEMYDLTASKISRPDHRGQTLLMKEILNPGNSQTNFTEDDFLKYAITWIRRNYEQHYNMSVVNATSPAQLFHVLRRQIHRPFVKPLVLLTGKWLHHHAYCRSNISDMGPGTWFRRIITEKSRANNMQTNSKSMFPLNEKAVKKIIFCSGKFYYELFHARTRKWKHAETERERRAATEITLVRLEQLAPFPMDRVASAVNNFPEADVVWAQEEPKNQGAWSYVQPRFATSMRCFYRGPLDQTPPAMKYVGRDVSATTAGGSFREHVKEQRDVIERALEL